MHLFSVPPKVNALLQEGAKANDSKKLTHIHCLLDPELHCFTTQFFRVANQYFNWFFIFLL
jgi:hypothetical protein